MDLSNLLLLPLCVEDCQKCAEDEGSRGGLRALFLSASSFLTSATSLTTVVCASDAVLDLSARGLRAPLPPGSSLHSSIEFSIMLPTENGTAHHDERTPLLSASYGNGGVHASLSARRQSLNAMAAGSQNEFGGTNQGLEAFREIVSRNRLLSSAGQDEPLIDQVRQLAGDVSRQA